MDITMFLCWSRGALAVLTLVCFIVGIRMYSFNHAISHIPAESYRNNPNSNVHVSINFGDIKFGCLFIISPILYL